jgi:hypothetical protein
MEGFYHAGAGAQGRQGRSSFLKKSSKKLSSVWLRPLRIHPVQLRKSFLVLFFQKRTAFFWLVPQGALR